MRKLTNATTANQAKATPVSAQISSRKNAKATTKATAEPHRLDTATMLVGLMCCVANRTVMVPVEKERAAIKARAMPMVRLC